MSATIISEPMMITTQDTTAAATTTVSGGAGEIQSAKCECCGLTEECTPAYIERIRERYMGKWVCGLCSEAVKDEVVRSERLITTDEALNRHFNVCRKFRSSPPAGGAAVIAAVRIILRRNGLRSTPASPTREAGERAVLRRNALARSESCFPRF